MTKTKRYRYSDGNTHTSNLSLAAAKKFQRLQNGGTVTLMTPASHWSIKAAREVIRNYTGGRSAVRFDEERIAEAFRSLCLAELHTLIEIIGRKSVQNVNLKHGWYFVVKQRGN